ncbi:hypothetical protein AJ78_08171 [Emergomyces pasteurianus Ep9510]|uniref:Uncharacterized protein n=1 Tax=Emergomyces pasteurianus Ep9510 TaxID=1447872 RepID=A0A1J9Q709_9EURO|nr:hypothetical protein AJ78_08171 [Emergomyces pasteurianus Ep9510]
MRSCCFGKIVSDRSEHSPRQASQSYRGIGSAGENTPLRNQRNQRFGQPTGRLLSSVLRPQRP